MQTISVFADGTILDKDNSSGTSTTLTLTKVGTGYALGGFSSDDVLGLDPWLEVVSDTTVPAPSVEAIRSIAAMNPDPKHNFGTVFAASDSVLYDIDLAANKLVRLSALPMNGLTLAEDVTGTGVYAYQKGGSNIFWTGDHGANWILHTTPPGAGITAFASANPGDDHAGDLFWVACGGQLYRFSFGSNTGTPLSCPIENITALEAEQGGVIVAGADGSIFDVPRSGAASPRTVIPGAIRGMAWNYVSTANGIYDFTHSGPPIDSNGNSAIYVADLSVFGARDDGTIDRFTIFGPSNMVNLSAPSSTATVTQFAFPYQGSLDPNKGIYVLAGSRVFYRQDASTWVSVNQVLSSPPSLNPGTLTLLRGDPTWNAGYVENMKGEVPHGDMYQATSSGSVSAYLDRNVYDNLLIVSLTPHAGAMLDTANGPQYNLYYQKGVGLIRIERMEHGTETVTKLLR